MRGSAESTLQQIKAVRRVVSAADRGKGRDSVFGLGRAPSPGGEGWGEGGPTSISRRSAATWGLASLRHACVAVLAFTSLWLAGCQSLPRPGTLAPRKGDEIVVAGQFFHTGTPVVLWMDPGGYDAYRVERRFSDFDESSWETSKVAVPALITPNRYGLRKGGLTAEEIERVRGGGWDLPLLQEKVDQFVLHFDVSGTSQQCFKVLHDLRCLSVHFMLDLDGTIYQTLDLKERAWHATTSNTRSIGIEIANIGAYPLAEKGPLTEWYQRDSNGVVRVVIPPQFGESGIRTPNFVPRPARPDPVTGTIQGRELAQYDFTPEQYAALTKLTAALCKVFPKLKCDYPRDADGKPISQKLPDDELQRYQGIMGHYHVQSNKVDPGPALYWDKVVGGARKLLMRETPATQEKAATRSMRMGR
jgi:N-acetyl-anhydromuramyl-L-alanine amidase AmpD